MTTLKFIKGNFTHRFRPHSKLKEGLRGRVKHTREWVWLKPPGTGDEEIVLCEGHRTLSLAFLLPTSSVCELTPQFSVYD